MLNQVDPASLSADQVLLAYVDEETGIRGYILGRNFAYLSPAISGTQRADVGDQAVECRAG